MLFCSREKNLLLLLNFSPDIFIKFNKKMLQYMLWYNTEKPHHSLNKSEFSQAGMTYTLIQVAGSKGRAV
jgi:hypothetical protein